MIHLSGLTFSITPDEALVETRRKLVIKSKIWFYLEKIKTFGLSRCLIFTLIQDSLILYYIVLRQHFILIGWINEEKILKIIIMDTCIYLLLPFCFPGLISLPSIFQDDQLQKH